ncbi:bifunctional SulP family inorganic anion transporter/carbonic anhydrase [Schlesneria sp.]|uniref:bifunctional SulP family inorganic anion transporter/carbonic anhydrase n=1 Tax=Schlesneria sp. TaxID=2762018 RepID=UPI002F22C993
MSDITVRADANSIKKDLVAGVIVFLVALPLCLGVAMASNAPLISGVLAGIVGGAIVGILSGSHTSVSGPSPALAAVVVALLAQLGSFEALLLAILVSGVIQIILGLLRVGFIAAFIPFSVIQGLLAAIGVILILKQIPHVLGRDTDPEGDMSFIQPDDQTTFSELGELFTGFQPGAAFVGFVSLLILNFWHRSKILRRLRIPPPLVVVMFGVAAVQIFRQIGGTWLIAESHLVQVPVAQTFSDLFQFLHSPDFSRWDQLAIYQAGLTIAMITTLETLLNIDAIDKVDPERRVSPPSRELLAQGVGNVILGLIGGIPISSVIVRSSVNINAGAQTKLSAIFHGFLMLFCVMMLPTYLNMIPLACLAAILLMTGLRLITLQLIRKMWSDGRYQFIPFATTLVAIVLTDLVTGVLIGLAVSIGFILNSNFRQPLRRILEKHLGGDVLRIVLANQVSFLNRGALEKILRDLPEGSHVLLDAESTDYIDPDVLTLISDFKERVASNRGVKVSLRGFRKKYHLEDDIQFVDYSTRQLQEDLTSQEVLRILKEGNERFYTGQRLTRDLGRQLHATSQGQSPIAVVLSCIDSRAPAELILDLGIGDIFSVRMAGHVTSQKVLGSLEYGCNVAGSKLILVLGHTRCGAVTAAVNLAKARQNAGQATGCQHLESIIHDIQLAIDPPTFQVLERVTEEEKPALIESVAVRNVELCVKRIVEESETIRRLVEEGRVAVVGAVFDITTGKIEFLNDELTVDQRSSVASLSASLAKTG